jgi:putative hemolysin
MEDVMKKKSLFVLCLFLAMAVLTGCRREPQLANPASVYCEKNGGTLEIRDDVDGQVGICVFPDGSECDEWAFYRGECSPGEN